MAADPTTPDSPPEGRIVVGVDGSDGARAALRWALSEARLRSVALEVVHAWSYLHAAGQQYVSYDAMHRAARHLLGDAVAGLGDTGAVAITETLVEGPAAEVLVRVAQGAALLVVGTRGRGGFAGLLLGSVSQHVAHRAACPIVIVPADELHE